MLTENPIGGYDGALVGGASGDEARVVPDQNDGTGEDITAALGTSSHSVMAIAGKLAPTPPAEKLPRSICEGSEVKAEAKVVSSDREVGLCPQSKEVGVEAMRFSSIDSIPCMGAFTWAANWASRWCIRLSKAAWCSLQRVGRVT